MSRLQQLYCSTLGQRFTHLQDALAAASLDWYGIAKKLRRAAKPHQAAVLRDEMLLATATLSAVAPVVRQPTAPVPPAAKMTGPPAADVPGPPVSVVMCDAAGCSSRGLLQVDAVRQRCEEIGDIFFSAASAEVCACANDCITGAVHGIACGVIVAAVGA